MATTKYKQKIKGSKDAAAPHLRLAAMLQEQARAKEAARRNLKKQYINARSRNRVSRRRTVSDLVRGFSSAREGYDQAESDATANLGTVTNSSRLNRARENASAMAEIANMGGGLTDRIKAMAPAVRNLKANLDGGVNDYANAITGLNNSLRDLNSSTETNINNALTQENVSNAQAFAEWSAGNQQSYADMVDLFGQRGAALEEAAMALADKKSSSKSSGTKSVKSTQEDEIDHNDASRAQIRGVEQAQRQAVLAARNLAAWQGQTFKDQYVTIDQMNAETANPGLQFTRAAMKENQSNLDELANAGTLKKLADAEGSKLRKTVRA